MKCIAPCPLWLNPVGEQEIIEGRRLLYSPPKRPWKSRKQGLAFAVWHPFLHIAIDRCLYSTNGLTMLRPAIDKIGSNRQELPGIINFEYFCMI